MKSEANPVHGRVIARWEIDRALLETDSGSVVSVVVPEEIQDAFDVGLGAWLAVDAYGVEILLRFEAEARSEAPLPTPGQPQSG